MVVCVEVVQGTQDDTVSSLAKPTFEKLQRKTAPSTTRFNWKPIANKSGIRPAMAMGGFLAHGRPGCSTSQEQETAAWGRNSYRYMRQVRGTASGSYPAVSRSLYEARVQSISVQRTSVRQERAGLGWAGVGVQVNNVHPPPLSLVWLTLYSAIGCPKTCSRRPALFNRYG